VGSPGNNFVSVLNESTFNPVPPPSKKNSSLFSSISQLPGKQG